VISALISPIEAMGFFKTVHARSVVPFSAGYLSEGVDFCWVLSKTVIF